MFARCDENGDGMLSYDEFVKASLVPVRMWAILPKARRRSLYAGREAARILAHARLVVPRWAGGRTRRKRTHTQTHTHTHTHTHLHTHTRPCTDARAYSPARDSAPSKRRLQCRTALRARG